MSMSIESILKILDRAHKGPLCTVKDWNTRLLPGAVSRKLKEHDLNKVCDTENPINIDDELADKFYKAGFELAVELGMLCQDTERVITVTEDELRDALSDAPSELALGEGLDMVILKHRKPEDKQRPLFAAPLGIVVSEDLWVPLHVGIVQHREVDILEGGTLVTIFGRPVLAGTPYETAMGRYHAQLNREALWRAGRPGMCTQAIISSTTEFGQLGGYGIAGGFDPAVNAAKILAPGEMITTYTTLHKVVHAINCGSIIRTGFMSMIAGYPGPCEGVVLTIIASTLQQFAIHQTHFTGGSVMDARYSGASGREAQWVASIAYQAISRNTHLLRNGTINEVAGPCTEMLLYECAVETINASVSGESGIVGPRSGSGKYADYLTPLECKFCGEVLKCAAGMTRKEANEIVKVLIPKYEDKLMNPDKGQSFRECYDLKTLEPTKEWLDIYLKIKNELIELGVPLSN